MGLAISEGAVGGAVGVPLLHRKKMQNNALPRGGDTIVATAPRVRTPRAPSTPSPMWKFLFNPRYPLALLVVFLLFATAWAINPHQRADWILENTLTALFLA